MTEPHRVIISRQLLALGPLGVLLLACTSTVSAPPGPLSEAGGTSATGGTGSVGPGTGGTTMTGSGGTTAGTSGSGAGGTGEPPAPNEPLPVDLSGQPLYSRFLRLTNDQWENAVKDILKLSAPSGLAADFLHAVTGVTDFSNNERVVIVNDTVWSDFQLAAETVAAKVTATDAALQAVVATTDAATFIKTFGRRAFRRDLTADEVTKYTALHTEGGTYSGSQSEFTKGAALVITAMLQSPHFLYRMEMGDNGAPLSGYEMASKLSFWLRDTTPTDAMLDAAKGGTFDSADGAATQATAMLEEAGVTTVMRKFHNELYKFDLYDNVSKDNVEGYTEALNPEFKEASYLFFDRIFSENLGVKDILTTNVGFAGPNMAKLYGLRMMGSGLQQVTLAGRSGYYAQAPFLTLWAINDQPDSIHRGVRINLDTLCAVPGAPVNELPPVPAIKDGETNRDRYTALTNACGSTCHGQIINPIGFAFENYDGLGRERDMDNGQAVDTTGRYPFAEGMKDFAGAPEMLAFAAAGTQAHQCYAKRIASYALERDIVDAERPLVEKLGTTSLQGGASVKAVMLALVRENAFRTHVGGAQ